MRTLDIYTQVLIHSQTVACVAVCWVALRCEPRAGVHELALLQLLYLHDPAHCARPHYYNYTLAEFTDAQHHTVLWLTENHVAAAFRRKMCMWVCVSVVWSVMALVTSSARARLCGQYVAAALLAAAGAATLLVDVAHAALFLRDLDYTRTEADILEYVSGEARGLHWLGGAPAAAARLAEADTSWLPLAMAFCSVRGVTLWLINFWLIKDNYCDFLARHRHQTKKKSALAPPGP